MILALSLSLLLLQAPASDSNALASKVDQIFERYDKPDSPGCALSVIRDGKIVYKRGYGMANLEHDIRITPSSVFHVASVSKQFTAASMVLLAQESKLSLDDDVRKYVTELPNFGPSITIRHLIHHTSGLRDQWNLLGLAGWRYSLDLISDDDVLEMMSRQKDLNFTPGDEHLYCNTGYTLMGVIVKRVTGKSLREFTSAKIFEPLGMKNTHFRNDHAEIIKNQAYGYVRAGNTFRLSITNFDTTGATSLHTTVEDLALWDGNFDEPRVGGPALINQLQQRGRLNSGEEIDYAFGLVHGAYRGLKTVDHGGSDAGYRSHLIRFPEEKFSVACLCNIAEANPSQLVRRVADIYLDRDLRPVETAAPPTFAGLVQNISAGTYWNRQLDTFRKVSMNDGKPQLTVGNQNLEMIPVGPNRFRTTGRPFEMAFEAGKLREINEAGRTVESFEIAAEFKPTVPQLQDYLGDYRSEEMENIYRISVKDDKLTVKHVKSAALTLEPMVKDVFRGQPGAIRFVRDSSGRVSGFVLNSGRIRNFKFVALRAASPGAR